MNNATYIETQIQTANPVQLVVLMYDGVIRFLEQACQSLADTNSCERTEKIHNNLIRSQSIITELNSCLDMELGGNISIELRDIYEISNNVIREINMSKNPSDKVKILRIIHSLSELRDSWLQISKKL